MSAGITVGNINNMCEMANQEKGGKLSYILGSHFGYG